MKSAVSPSLLNRVKLGHQVRWFKQEEPTSVCLGPHGLHRCHSVNNDTLGELWPRCGFAIHCNYVLQQWNLRNNFLWKWKMGSEIQKLVLCQAEKKNPRTKTSMLSAVYFLKSTNINHPRILKDKPAKLKQLQSLKLSSFKSKNFSNHLLICTLFHENPTNKTAMICRHNWLQNTERNCWYWAHNNS